MHDAGVIDSFSEPWKEKKKQNENRSKTVVVPLVGTIYDNQIAFFIANIYVLNVYFSFCII